MNITSLEITKEEAADRLRHYESMIAAERTVEDEAIMAGYRAAARGLPVIVLPEVMRLAGLLHDNGLPRMAICRADAKQCFVTMSRDNMIFGLSREAANRGGLVGRTTVRVPLPEDPLRRHHWIRGHTIVPTIPPQYRPKIRHLHRYHVLWEVEAWTQVPPRDPALVKHIRGDLWSVLAIWDLTDLERAVLSQRAAPSS